MKHKPQPTDTADSSPWPFFAEDEVEDVASVLRSGRINYHTGQLGREFERRFADYCGAQYGVALANGTVALELALRALDIGPGDEVIVTPRSFVASASCVLQVGATPQFCDIDPASQDLTAATIEHQINDKTAAIVAVHLAGWPCEMDEILDLATRHGLAVIEDCAQAHGAKYKGRPVGGLGDIGVFSFCQDKIISTGGEGGMLVTNSPEVYERTWSLKDHGKDRVTLAQVAASDDPSYKWVHESLGSNLRMTEMQSAIGIRQLAKLDDWVRIRRRNANLLFEGMRDLGALRIPEPAEHVYHAYYKAYAFVVEDALRPKWNRNRIISEIRGRGFRCFSGSCGELYREGVFAGRLAQEELPFSTAHQLAETSLMFEVHPTLSVDAMRALSQTVRDVMLQAQT